MITLVIIFCRHIFYGVCFYSGILCSTIQPALSVWGRRLLHLSTHSQYLPMWLSTLGASTHTKRFCIGSFAFLCFYYFCVCVCPAGTAPGCYIVNKSLQVQGLLATHTTGVACRCVHIPLF